MKEIQKGLARQGITQQFFTFKIMTPIYPSDEGKLTDSKYYDKLEKPWGYFAHKKEEAQIIKNIKPILREFQLKANFKKKELKKFLDETQGEVKDFDKNFEHIYGFAFRDNNINPEMEVNATLWVRELYLNSQLNCAPLLIMTNMMLSVATALVPYWGGHLLRYFGEEREELDNPNFWPSYGPLGMVVFVYTMMNTLFMNFAMIDASKKNIMMKRLSQCIDIFFHNKDPITIRFPVFNIIDPKSIMTWIEIRKLIMSTGSRFQIRI